MNKIIHLTSICVIFYMIIISTEEQNAIPSQMPIIVDNCMVKMRNETGLCINKSEKDWNITDDYFGNTKKLCCSTWDYLDCIYGYAKV